MHGFMASSRRASWALALAVLIAAAGAVGGSGLTGTAAGLKSHESHLSVFGEGRGGAMANVSWRIARNRGSAQLPLLIVAALAIVLVLLGKAQSSLFDRARVEVTDWMAPGLEAVRAPVLGVGRWIGSIGEVFTVYSENLKLKDENARLRQWQNAAVVLGDRVRHYQQLLHAVPDPKLHTVLARVIGRDSRPFLETMILDAGKAAGVKPGEAIIDARGMIGRVYLTGQRTSWVILLSDLNSRIPVTIEPGNVQAIMSGDNSRNPVLDLLARTVTLKAGAQVVTSGDGGILPAGLPIGTAVPYGSGYRVVLLADPASSQDVEILDYRKPPEVLPLPSPADLPATIAGLPPAMPQPAAPPAATPQPAAAQVRQTAPKVPPKVHPSLPQAARPTGADTGNE